MTRRFSDAVARDGRRLRRGFCISSDRIQCRFDYGPGRSNRFVVEIAKNADLLPVIAAKFTRRCFRTADEVEQKRPDARAFLIARGGRFLEGGRGGRAGCGSNQRFSERAVWYAKLQSCRQAMRLVSDGG